MRDEVGVVAAELLDRALGRRGEEVLVHRESRARAAAGHRAPQQAAQHVARALVARQRALGDRERQRADVVGDDARVAQRDLPVRDLLRVREHRVHERREQVGLEDGVPALEDEREALDAHAGVDAGVREQFQLAVRLRVELREHEVPELHVAIARVARRLAPERALGQVVGALLAEVEVDLAARPARARAARGAPEVVLPPERHDVVGLHPQLDPQRRRLVVARDTVLAAEDGDVQPVRRQAEHLRHELPREGGRLFLEVGALRLRPEREVAQHLEERVVARRQPHVVQVRQAQALLDRGRARVGHVRSRVVRLELHHARGREHERRVAVRHEPARGHLGVPALDEEVEERPAQLGAGLERGVLGHPVSRDVGAARRGRSRKRPGRSGCGSETARR